MILRKVPPPTATRPNHAERYRTLRAELAADVFGAWEPSKTAIYGIAGALNYQLALAQKMGIPKDTLEAAIRAPFALGYIFGGAAWHADRFAVPRPSPEADKVILAAYLEALGPLTDTEIATISAEAARGSRSTRPRTPRGQASQSRRAGDWARLPLPPPMWNPC